MKAAGNIRVSSVQQTFGESLELQEKAIKTYCNAHKYDLVMYRDEGISGITTEARPGWSQLIEDAKNRQMNVVVVHSLSRAGRSVRELLNNIQKFKDCEVNFVSISEGIDLSSPYGSFTLTILGAVAEIEHHQIKERTLGGKISKWSKGECFIVKTPYGYRFNKKENRFEIVEHEAAIVKQIVNMYLNECLSFISIALKLREQGIKGREGKKPGKFFSSAKLQYMLKNTAYYGTLITENFTYRLPPIIDKLTWDTIQEKRKSNKIKGKRVTKAEPYWLRDLLQCGECGGAVKPRHSSPRKDGGFQRYYSCYWAKISNNHAKAANREKCKSPFIKADELEEQIEAQVIHDLGFDVLMGNRENLLKVLSPESHEQRKAELSVNLQQVQSDIKRKHRALNNLIDLLEDDDFDKIRFKQKHDTLVDEIATLNSRSKILIQELDQLETTIAENASFLEFVENNREWLKNIQKELLDLSPADKKRFYESIFQGKITLYLDADESEGIPPHGTFKLPPIRLNATIFQLLSSEGKISQFKEKSLDKFARNHFP
jgi:site-specific DNA recombinase